MLTLGNKLNRSYSLYLPFMENYCEISILFNKTNSFIGFNLDQTHYVQSRNGDIKSFLFPELTRSAFATTFLDLKDLRTKNLDIKQQFYNIKTEFKNRIHYETNETIKLTKVITPKGDFDSTLYIYVFRFTDFGNNFLYTLVERQHIDIVLDKKIVRTAAIQLSSNEANEDLATMVQSYNQQYIETESIDKVLHQQNIFEERKSVL